MRSPSERLIHLLTSTGLCTRAELDHCEPFVRQLSHDLPDFDTVWLDALVQQRSLTPWQADCIQADRSEDLVVGRFHLQQAPGRSTFLALDASRRTFSILRLVERSGGAHDVTLENRLEELLNVVDRSRGSAPASLLLPTEIAIRRVTAPDSSGDTASQRYLVSHYIRGWSMEELLIRGGRLPASVVAEIGRELLTALTWLESNRLLHGDLVTRNVHLSPRGGVHLTSPFVRRLLQPQFALTDQLSLRDCEGIAPEQVGTGRTADVRSELYSLGCLLWQLLSSRPVILAADPVTRLMKQKDHDIADVRGLVPDCPEWMSRILLSMTRRSPELRPGSAGEVLKVWRAESGNSLSHCRALARSMPDHFMRSRREHRAQSAHSGSSRLWPVAAASVLCALVFLAARSGVLPKTLELGALNAVSSLTSVNVIPERQRASTVPQTSPQAFPPINAEGVVELQAGAVYLATPLEFPGSLRIVCSQPPTATVLVDRESRWQLKARSIELLGISLLQNPTQTSASDERQPVPKAARQLLELQCASLSVSNCVIRSPSDGDTFDGITWRRAPGEEGSIAIRNSVFSGGGSGIFLSHPPRRCELDNVLLANRVSGILCAFQKGDKDTFEISCSHVTQRFGASVIDTVIHDETMQRVNIMLTSSECVYSPTMAVLRLQGPESMQPESMEVHFRSAELGNPAVIPPSTIPAVYVDRRLRQAVGLPLAQVTDNDLLLAELLFEEVPESDGTTGSDVSEWSGSVLADFEGPKLTPVMPGIDLHALPQEGELSGIFDR